VTAVVTAGAAGATDVFSISGEVEGLYPGFHGTIGAQVTNTLDVPIHVHEVSGVATDSSAGCDPATLTIATAKTSLELAPGETGRVPLEVTMRADAGDACQGASFRLHFQGSSLAQDRDRGTLAFTGTDTATLMAAAVVVLAIGIALVRRTRTRSAP
jgi:hypothetical protein